MFYTAVYGSEIDVETNGSQKRIKAFKLWVHGRNHMFRLEVERTSVMSRKIAIAFNSTTVIRNTKMDQMVYWWYLFTISRGEVPKPT